MDSDAVQVISKGTVYDGYFRIDKYVLRHRKHDGAQTEVLNREVFERGHVAAVLPVDTERDALVLIEQFRPGAYAAHWEPWLLECVAGVVEADESTEDVAYREAQEEAGCSLRALHPIERYLSSPGACSETVQLYCGQVDSRGAGGIHGLANEGEDIKVHVVAVPTAIEWLDQGRITNAKTIIALHWLARHYDWLKSHWQPAGEGAEEHGES